MLVLYLLFRRQALAEVERIGNAQAQAFGVKLELLVHAVDVDAQVADAADTKRARQLYAADVV